MSLIRKITSVGVEFAGTRSEKRNVILSNYISLVLTLANILLLIGRLSFRHEVSFALQALLPGTFLFLLPIVLNLYGRVLISRLWLCWFPTVFLMYAAVELMSKTLVPETTYYVGIRYLMLATNCVPFVLFDLRDRPWFFLATAIPLSMMLFFDPYMNLFGLGYEQVGLADRTYSYSNVRAVVSMLIIGSCFVLLKVLIDKNERKNDTLIKDLDEKNRLIQSQRDNEVYKLNQELKSNIKQLSEREFILNESQRAAHIGSWEYRIKGNAIFWSEEMYNIFGLDDSYPATASTLSSLLTEEHKRVLDFAIVKLTTDGEQFDFTVQATTPLGHFRWVRICAFPLYYDQKIIGARGICHDVSFNRAAEEQMRLSEIKYRTLFEQASESIMITDFEGNFKDVNATMCGMLGYSKAELLHMNISQLMGSAQSGEPPIPFQRIINGEQVFSDRTMIHRNGSVIFVESNLKRLGDDKIMAIARDTTELRRAEREIQINEAKFRGAFEDSAIGMTLVALDGAWIKVNKAFCQITGYTEEELLGMKFQEMTHPDDLASDEFNMERFVLGEIDFARLHKRYIHRDGHAVWVNVNVSAIRDLHKVPQYYVTQIEDITALKNIEQEKERARYMMNERVKELTTLYRTSQILNDDQKSMERAMQQIANVLPPGWQYPDVTVARIVVNGIEWRSDNFAPATYLQSAEFQTTFGMKGFVEVGYQEERPPEAEGPFLAEERSLINMIAEMIRVFLVRRHESEALSRSEANLSATINNSETLIWSVDRDFRLVTFNRPFTRFVKETYGVDIKEGMAQLDLKVSPEIAPIWEVIAFKWQGYYTHVLEGNGFTTEDVSLGKIFRYSLSPIIVNQRIIGISVFANDITEQKSRETELVEMNKKVGELKLMALRSVMNPHFIFNVLNSIQFFIAKNDRVNAINYLSTFSKLIRGILTHSISNKIRLEDEMDMLRNYVELERTRFEDKFSFKLEVAEDVEADGIEIPPLLIQPYVENAILHGLNNKTGSGNLRIGITQDEQCVVFEISDDGIGREAALKLKQQNLPSHKSMGIKITEERLKLINEAHAVSSETIDLKDPAGAAAGTMVRVKIRR